MAAPQPVAENYTQPALPTSKSGFNINCLDYQILTKSDGWNQDQTKRLNEYQEYKNLLANPSECYVALAVPYDNLTKYTNYVTDARTKGFKVWHRSHWNRWQGDNGEDADMTAQEYLDDTYDFIVENPTLFADGDLFTTCVECNNADGENTTNPFRTDDVFDFTKYNRFCRDQVTYANAAFLAIGKSVRTNLLSFSLSLLDLNGQSLDSGDGGNASGIDDAGMVAWFDSMVTIDHYLSADYRDGTTYATNYAADMVKLKLAFPSCRFMIGEWGFHTQSAGSDGEQHGVYDAVSQVIRERSDIIGLNYWNHLGQTQSSLWTDTSGTINPGGRTAVRALSKAFNTGNASNGWRVRV